MPALVPDLLKVFSEKLDRTGSFDQAFTKAVWMAYKQGIEDGVANSAQLQSEANNGDKNL